MQLSQSLVSFLQVFRGDREDEEALDQWHQQRKQAQADGCHLPSSSAAQASSAAALTTCLPELLTMLTPDNAQTPDAHRQ